jgi:hypothetical protein
MKICFLFFALLFSTITQGQFLEKVFLKDSVTVYQGWIIEQVPQEHIKILRFKERDTITIEVGDIWKIAREIDVKHINKIFNNPLIEKKGLSQAVFLELLGNAGVYSINYDRRFTKGHRSGWGGRVGFSYLKIKDSGTLGYQTINLLAIPADINYLIGKRRGALELGIGATYVSSRSMGRTYTFDNLEVLGGGAYNIKSNGVFAFMNFVYRHRSLNNGFMYKAGFSPIIFPAFFLTIGIAVGYNFQKH